MTNYDISFLKKYFLLLVTFCNVSFADNFETNIYNNHGVVGLINTPTARFFDESVHGITFYDGTPDQKITLSSNPSKNSFGNPIFNPLIEFF